MLPWHPTRLFVFVLVEREDAVNLGRGQGQTGVTRLPDWATLNVWRADDGARAAKYAVRFHERESGGERKALPHGGGDRIVIFWGSK